MTPDPRRPAWVVAERRYTFGRAIVTGLLIMAALTWGISGPAWRNPL